MAYASMQMYLNPVRLNDHVTSIDDVMLSYK